MVRKKSQKSKELESILAEAILGIQNKKYKSSYEAAKALGLSRNTVTIESYERLQMKSGQISVAFFSLNNYSYNNYNYNYNHSYNYNVKVLTYLLGKIGFHDLFKGILTYMLS
ncbi:hypothetical protein V502_02217 [Pseudogymnoascus sp. VKM F-4520 (FW-2644)]|nr:hypothetical protein V502_02217 [Pseudogymnoascus sp. VKM F-4520 (FW-2644)]